MDTTTIYGIHNSVRLLLGAVFFLFLMIGIIFVVQQHAISDNREATKCLLAQQLQHRFASRDADTKEAQALGYEYSPPEVVRSPSLEEVIAADDQLLEACDAFLQR